MKPLILVLICLAIFLVRFKSSLQVNQNLDRFEGKQISITGKISSNISLQDNSQSFNLGRIRVKTTLYPRYNYGDELIISGTLQSKVINRWHRRFSLIYPGIELVESGNNIFIGLKNRLEANIQANLPEPEAGLVSGIVLGSKSALSAEFWQALQQTGTLHLVVASGYNVSVILGAVVGYLSGLIKRQWAIGLGIVVVGIYAFMVGLEPAIVRASLMGSLAYLAQALGRPAQTLRLLFLAAGVMLFINPLTVFDVGFQLSFLATLGLIVLCPRLQRVPAGVRESLAAQIFVWPILLYNFGQLMPFSILVNSLIVWLVPFIMLLGAAVAVSGWLVFGWLVYVPAHLMVKIIYVFA
jgi:competence protein ComEC